jgi:hypothetical protein
MDPEACLGEVSIEGERILDREFVHEHEACAVRVAPSLVWAVYHEAECSGVSFRFNPFHIEVSSLSDEGHELHHGGMSESHPQQGVTLAEHIVRGDEASEARPGGNMEELPRLVMIDVSLIGQDVPSTRVDEDYGPVP